ncbi:serine/arginine repetitive matrix protein 1-like isoform X2 [Panicum virgatum]|uniref:serine/arginine repetitive matrix protein 1-like isoform X2 n=1 Tax=Panicum virgatum TaxID=38727 RepID=UPI0019D668E2|nr:serine/arginine repetitive matrix protein 1-like isoform X2 [Panicum virgatum]
MDGSPPPRREGHDPSNEGPAEPSRESREAPTEHPRSRWWRRRPPPGSLSRRTAYPSPPILVGPDQSRDDGTGSPPPRREAHDPSNEASAEPSRESREAPTEHRRSRRSQRRELLRRRQPSPGSMDEGAADPSPASHASSMDAGSFPFLEFQDLTTGLRFPTESALLQFMSDRLLGSGTSHPRTGAHVRQSLLYSDRPRRSRTRRPAPAEECTREESSSDLGKAVIDLPTIETLSLSDPPLLTPQTEADEETDDDCAWGPNAGQTALYFNRPKGLSRSMVLSLADSLFITVSNDEEERPKPYPDEDPEELLRRIKEYLDASPCIDLSKLSVASDRIEAIEDVNLDSHAAELGTEPPSVLTEQTSVAAERHEASTAWMKEVMLCFKKLIEISPDLTELEDYHLHELCHQCFNVESYDKVYHHYNFTVNVIHAKTREGKI